MKKSLKHYQKNVSIDFKRQLNERKWRKSFDMRCQSNDDPMYVNPRGSSSSQSESNKKLLFTCQWPNLRKNTRQSSSCLFYSKFSLFYFGPKILVFIFVMTRKKWSFIFFTVLYQSKCEQEKKSINYPPKLDFFSFENYRSNKKL